MGSAWSGGDDTNWPIKETSKKIDVGKGPGGVKEGIAKTKRLHPPSEATVAFYWALLKTRGESFKGDDCSISGGFGDLVAALPSAWDGGGSSVSVVEQWKTDAWRGEAVLFFHSECAVISFTPTDPDARLTDADGYYLKMYLE